eukprot:5942193-Prymnesium_polylepis.6
MSEIAASNTRNAQNRCGEWVGGLAGGKQFMQAARPKHRPTFKIHSSVSRAPARRRAGRTHVLARGHLVLLPALTRHAASITAATASRTPAPRVAINSAICAVVGRSRLPMRVCSHAQVSLKSSSLSASVLRGFAR